MRTSTWAARVLPALGLAVLSPLIGEYLLGNISIRELAAVPFLLPMYGGGALLIREVARRTGRGWPAILVLGLAYGVIEPGVFDGSLFSASFEGMDYAAARIPVLDVSAFYGLQFVVNHAIWSITIPIVLTEACAPRLRAVPWLGRIALAATAAAYVLGGLLIRSYGIDEGEYHTTGARAAGVILVALMLVITAFLLPRPAPARGDGWVPRSWQAGVCAFLAAGGYFVMPPGWPGVVAEVLLIAAAALVVARLARRTGWHARHRTALATGAMMTYAWAGFLLTTLKHDGDPVAFAGNGLLAAAALALGVIAIRRTAATPAPTDPKAAVMPRGTGP